MCDVDIERRPYHRNYKCALHKSKRKCSHSTGSKHRNVAFPRTKFSISLSSCYLYHSSTWYSGEKKFFGPITYVVSNFRPTNFNYSVFTP
ncbi:hypothetical protein ACS0TY_021196 [Phlomoides rotata]